MDSVGRFGVGVAGMYCVDHVTLSVLEKLVYYGVILLLLFSTALRNDQKLSLDGSRRLRLRFRWAPFSLAFLRHGHGHSPWLRFKHVSLCATRRSNQYGGASAKIVELRSVAADEAWMGCFHFPSSPCHVSLPLLYTLL